MRRATTIWIVCFLLLGFVYQGKTQIVDLCSSIGAAQTLPVNTTCSNTAYSMPDTFMDEIADPTCSVSERDGWYRFTPAAGQTSVTITASTDRNVGIAVYIGTCTTLAQVACVNNGGGSVTETLTMGVTAGTTYYIRLFRVNTGTNTMAGNICITTPVVNTTCSATFQDNGGTGNYLANSNYAVTYCPSTAGQCVRATFTTFNTESGVDLLRVYNGNSVFAPPLGGPYSGTTSPGTLTATSTNPTGCLTFYFTSDGSTQSTGWDASISCVPCPTGSTALSQDCFGGTTVCSDAAFSGNSSGSGNDNDLNSNNQGCLTVEHQSSWFYFSVSATGTIALNINPTTPTDDYDFAIWGPMSTITCPPNTAPIRCSYSAVDGVTGLNASAAGQNTEGTGGDGFVDVMNVVAGQKYVMLIDNFSASASPFTLDWTLTGGASLNCTVLPVQLAWFRAGPEGKRVKIDWETLSELHNDYFTIEKSTDGTTFFALDKIQGAGTVSSPRTYKVYDENPSAGYNYYRLKQTDFDGESTYSQIEAVKFGDGDGNIPIEVFPVPTTGTVNVVFSETIAKNTAINVLDITGRVIIQQTIGGEDQRVHAIDLSGVNKGIYFLVAETPGTGKKSSLKKIIVE